MNYCSFKEVLGLTFSSVAKVAISDGCQGRYELVLVFGVVFVYTRGFRLLFFLSYHRRVSEEAGTAEEATVARCRTLNSTRV